MNKRIRTSLLSAALAGGTVLGAAQIGGVANAQVDDTTPVEVDADTVVPGADTPDTDRAERRSMRLAARQAVADLIGVDTATLRTELREGSTLADVAEANGVESEAVVDLIVEQKTERINQAVENDRITQEEADEKIAGLDERVTTRVEEGRPERADGERGRRGQRGGGADVAADAVDAQN